MSGLASGDFYAHPSALVSSTSRVGRGTRVWAFCNILDGAVVGEDCQLCDRVFVEGGAVLGDRVTVKCGVSIWSGIHLGDDVFVGPGVLFTNDPSPRSGRVLDECPVTRIETYASLGAGAVILPGLVVGTYCMVGAGAVVTSLVPPFGLVVGNPARLIGHVCACGRRLVIAGETFRCSACGTAYRGVLGNIQPVGELPRLPSRRRGQTAAP